MSSNIDHKAVEALLRGQGCANNLKTLLNNRETSPVLIEPLINTIVDSFSVVRSFVDSPNPPPHHESSFQSMASLVPKSKISGAEGNYGDEYSPSPRLNDGFIWRKYGQKNIKSSPHQRFYYRCVCAKDEICNARKQVQKIKDNPPVYRTTYVGKHNCATAIFAVNDDTYGSKMIHFGQTVSESVMPPLATVNVNQTLTMKEKDTNHIMDMDEVFEVNEFMNNDDWKFDYPMLF